MVKLDVSFRHSSALGLTTRSRLSQFFLLLTLASTEFASQGGKFFSLCGKEAGSNAERTCTASANRPKEEILTVLLS